MKLRKGWTVDPKGLSATYYGDWMRLVVHRIQGLRENEWFFTCFDLHLDCVPLRAETLEAAREQALRHAASMCRSYMADIEAAAGPPRPPETELGA